MNIKQELDRQLLEWGASFTGYSRVDGKLSPNLSKLNFAITIGIRLSDFTIDEITDKPTYTYFHHYRTVNTLIDQITLKGLMFLQDRGFRAVAVPASQSVKDTADSYCGIFPHKTAAVSAGCGWMGKNGLFISLDYGPRVRLGTILTDMDLKVENNINGSRCGSCNKCVSSCPAKALTGNEWYEGCGRDELVNAKTCSEYMNANFKHIGRGSVCGICIKVCPHGEKRSK